MDPLDEMLDGVRVQRAMVGQSRFSPPWSLAVESDDPFRLVAMIEGAGWLKLDGREAVPLAEGAVAVVAARGRIVVADDPDAAPDVVITGVESCFDPRTGDSLLDHERTAPRSWGAPDAPVAVLLAGYGSSGQRFATLAAGLPDLLVAEDSPATRALLEVAAAETTSAEPGQQTMFDRLMELLLVGTLRAQVTAERARPSWHRALSDPLVGPAVRAIHDAPGERWTVDLLAATTAQSRAAFARRFRDVVGEPPITYLTRWRLACAADLLAGGESVEGAARAVGYHDPFAFSTAFRRHHGTTPSQHRRAHRADLASTTDGIG